MKIVCLLTLGLACATVWAQQGSAPQGGLSKALASTALSGSQPVSEVSGLSVDQYASIELPPLQTLLDNAHKAPREESFRVQAEIDERELKSLRREWLGYFKLSASYQYGVSNYYALYDDPNPIPPSNDQARSYWNVGGGLSLPLVELFNRNNKIKQQKLRVRQSELEKDVWHDDQSLKIIDVYTTALQYLSVIKAQAEALTVSMAQYKVTEADFVNGKSDAQSLSRQRNILTQNITDYEQARAMLNSALLKLELLSKTKIINKDPLK